jgi:Ca-activated chloride channel family protein
VIRFDHGAWLHLLWLIPLLGLLLFWDLNRRDRLLRPLLRLVRGYSLKRRRLRALFWLLGMALLLVGLAGPKVGTKLEEVKREGVDIILALDVSQSMAAEDITPSRLEKAKHASKTFLDRLRGDRVGLIPFAGEPYALFPLTMDYAAAKLFIDILQINFVPLPGTEIAPVIAQAAGMYDEQSTASRVLIILTDGEDFGSGLDKAIQQAREQGIRIYTIGIGTVGGAPIPDFDEEGQRRGYKKDSRGEVILSHLDEHTLARLADETGGRYYLVTPGEAELGEIYREIYQLEKGELTSKVFTRFESRYQWFLLWGIIFLWLEFLLPESARVKVKSKDGVR